MIVHCICLGIKGYNFLTILYLCPRNLFFVLVNRVDLDKMPQDFIKSTLFAYVPVMSFCIQSVNMSDVLHQI